MKAFLILLTAYGLCYGISSTEAAEEKRTMGTSRKALKNDELSEEDISNEYYQELKTTSQQKYGTRKLPPTKPYCRTNCNTNKQNTESESHPSSSRPKVDSTSYEKAPKRKVVSKPKAPSNSGKIKEKVKFSRPYNPATISSDSGFVPIPSPFKNHPSKSKSSSTNVNRRAKLRSINDELTVKESRSNPNILGNGHFEILSGGIFSDQETNEIPGGGRRVGRTYETFALPQFRQMPFDIVQKFQFPSIYQGTHSQLPTHPMFFPRVAY